MHGAIVAGEITDETFDHVGGQAGCLVKPPNIKNVAWVLAIHRGHKFAAVKLGGGENRRG